MARTRSADRADAGESRVNCVELFQAGSKAGRNARFFVSKILNSANLQGIGATPGKAVKLVITAKPPPWLERPYLSF